MANPKSRAGSVLVERERDVVRDWIQAQLNDRRIRSELFRDEALLQDQARSFVRELSNAISSGNLEDIQAAEYEGVRRSTKDLIERRELLGFTPFEAAAAIICFKDSWNNYVQDACGNDLESAKRETITVAKLVDTIALMALESSVKRREEVISQQASAIVGMSTPVVQIWDGVVVVPLIGTLDTERAQRLTETLLERIVETEATTALLDITGVPTVDTKTAQHLIETISAVKLLGGEVVVTGVRPPIAQTLVHLGIDLQRVNTRPSLASGLRYAFSSLNLEVTSKNSH